LFLDLPSGEWVLEEFLGDWWFEQTKKLCGASVAGRRNSERATETLRKWRQDNPDLAKNTSSQAGRKGGVTAARLNQLHKRAIFGIPEEKVVENRKKGTSTQISKGIGIFGRYRCLVSGKEGTLAAVVKFQRKEGIDPTPENRIQIN
jgi:hypothetical protein